MRPVLKPGLRRLWRGPAAVQIGLDPGRALVLSGPDTDAVRALDALDGTHVRSSPSPPPGRDVVDLLLAAGLVDDANASTAPLAGLVPGDRERLAPDLASWSLLSGSPDGGLGQLAGRRGTGVCVYGLGRVGTAVAMLLAAAGLGAVEVRDNGLCRPADCAPGGLSPGDVGRRRDEAVRDLVGRYGTAHRTVGAPDLVVLTGGASADPRLRARLLRARVRHLAATVRETTGVVGALVLPGRSACLRCLDLHRADRDPAWPVVAAQLATRSRPPVEACDAVLATAVAARAAGEVLALLDGAPPPASVNGSLELPLPDWRWRRRSWTPHPGCDCIGDTRDVEEGDRVEYGRGAGHDEHDPRDGRDRGRDGRIR